MTGAHLPFQSTVVIPALAIVACAAPTTYAGISLNCTRNCEIAELARRAASGDKQAQLDLGVAFEEGQLVGRDLGRARQLYEQAASDLGGPRWVYQPPLGGQKFGRVLRIGALPIRSGLQDARQRLHRLKRGTR